MGTLDQAIRARDTIRARYRGAPWLSGLGIAPSEQGYGLEVRTPEPLRMVPNVDSQVPLRVIASCASAPLHVARWRWSGRPEVFDHLDFDRDGVVDERELERGLGRGIALLRDETSSPLDTDTWEGSPRVFHALDENQDGLVTREELEEGIGPHALRLVHGEAAHGPRLPTGAAYGWRGMGRWISFANRESKARYMAEAAEHDAQDPQVISWARQFIKLPTEKRAAAILRFVQRCIRYERDPAWYDREGTRHGVELLDSSAVGFFRAYGDCDLKARMFVALCLADGVQAEIEPVFKGENGFPHVRARVLSRDEETGGERWETADPTIVNSTIGHLPRKALTTFRQGG